LLAVISQLGLLPQERLFELGKSNGVGQKKPRSFIWELTSAVKLEEVKIPRAGKKLAFRTALRRK